MQVMKKSETFNPKTWTNVFPVVSTASDSLVFLKRLTNLAISTILYMRKIFPGSEFENKVFDGMTLRLLKNESNTPSTQKIRKWIAGALDALEKRYLKSMTLEIKDVRSNLALELYTIKVGYDEGNPTMSIFALSGKEKKTIFRNSKEKVSNIQMQTVRFLQMCYTVTKASSDLPPEITLSMRLTYQENTPPDYQPCGYKPCEPTKPVFLKKTRSIEIGVVHTNHHSVEFVSKTCLSDETLLPKVAKRKPANKSAGSSSSLVSSKVKSAADHVKNFPPQEVQKPQVTKEVVNSSQCTDDGSQSDRVRCPCLSQMKNSVMYRCSGCNYWVHAECFGILLSASSLQIELFYCQICHKLNKDHKCHDQAMTRLTRASDQQRLAVQRRLLSYCKRIHVKEVKFTRFERVSGLACQQQFLKSILSDMIGWGLLSEQPGHIYVVDKSKVLGKMPQFFYMGSPLKCKSPAGNEISNVKEQKTPELGKRKLEVNSEYGKKMFTGPRTQPQRAAKSLSVVKCLTQLLK